MDGWSEGWEGRKVGQLETVPLISASPARIRLARKEKLLCHRSGHHELINYSPLGKTNITLDTVKEKCESLGQIEKTCLLAFFCSLNSKAQWYSINVVIWTGPARARLPVLFQ